MSSSYFFGIWHILFQYPVKCVICNKKTVYYIFIMEIQLLIDMYLSVALLGHGILYASVC